MADTNVLEEAARERDETRTLWIRAWREAGLEGDPTERSTAELAKGVTDAIQATRTEISAAHMAVIGEDFDARVPLDRLARDVAQAVKDGAHEGPVDCPALRDLLAHERIARAREQAETQRAASVVLYAVPDLRDRLAVLLDSDATEGARYHAAGAIDALLDLIEDTFRPRGDE